MEKVMLTIKPTEPAKLVLTKTMLEKAIIDANASVRQFGRLFGVVFEDMAAGDRVQLDAEFLDGSRTTLSFYKTKNRGDRRFSIRGIKKQAEIGDTIALCVRVDATTGEAALVINVDRNAEYGYVLNEVAG
jgi:hypothetical protein